MIEIELGDLIEWSPAFAAQLEPAKRATYMALVVGFEGYHENKRMKIHWVDPQSRKFFNKSFPVNLTRIKILSKGSR